MKATIENTNAIIKIFPDSGPCIQGRVWHGKIEKGIKFEAVIVRLAVDKKDNTAEFEKDLKAVAAPGYIPAAIPLRIII